MGLITGYIDSANRLGRETCEDALQNRRPFVAPDECGEFSKFQSDALLWCIRYDIASNQFYLLRLNTFANWIVILLLMIVAKLYFPAGLSL